MTYVALNTRTMEVSRQETYEKAAQWLLDSLNGDNKDDFWIDETTGRLRENDHNRLDFSLTIFNSENEYSDSLNPLR